MAAKDSDQIQELFANRGLRCTTQRRALYKILAASTDHPTAEQLFYQVSGYVPGMSLATVYNTLEAFCVTGLAQKLLGQGGSVRYDPLVQNHLHARCSASGAVHDVPDELGQKVLRCIPRRVLREIETKMGFKIDQVHIELAGHHFD